LKDDLIENLQNKIAELISENDALKDECEETQTQLN
jgi:predicted nuclease with TOPRIM domain